MISAKNYAAQVEERISALESLRIPYNNIDVDLYMYGLIKNIIKSSIHFALPDDGSIFDDDLKGLEGVQCRIPYPSITVEYYVPESESLYHEETPTYSPRRLVVAYEQNINELLSICKQNNTIYENVSKLYSDFPDDMVLTIVVANQLGEQWAINPLGWIMPVTWNYKYEDGVNIDSLGFDNKSNVRFSGKPNVVLPGLYEATYGLHGYEGLKCALHDIGGEIRALLELCEALTCSNVTTETIQHENKKLNSKRINKGKLPIYETKQLVIEVPKSAKNHGAGLGIDRSSPRQHLRRGHIRRLSNDKRIWVNSCVVGSSDLGNIHKSYSVVPSR